MKCQQLLLLWCCSSIPELTRCIAVGGFLCVTAYWDTISCFLNITGDPVESNTIYNLTFKSVGPGKGESCPLRRMNDSYSCFCKIHSRNTFANYNKYDITLCHSSVCYTVTKGFTPHLNIQLTPPHQPEVQETPEAVNVTWKSGYERHHYLKELDYMLQLETSESTEAKTSQLNSLNKSLLILMSELKRHATYCVKVRSKPKSREYKGIWSEWSPTTCWKNGEEDEEEEDEDNKLFILIKSLGPVCLAVGVMLFVLNKPAIRKKIQILSQTPTPAPFFQPLFQQHGGDLKEWLQPQGKFALTYKTEEMLTTDAVIVEPKPVTKDPEEHRVFFNPMTHLALAQCHTSYVGLPGVHEATPPLAMACPVGTPYTRLHCSAWGVAAEEAEVVSALPQDFLNISSEDSGCSCADPTQSPECSLPSSPVDDCPPPSICVDYCILNKTAAGFVPVLLSQGGSLDVPSNSLQEE
uniref:interleukin-2 receptor subunit beta-like isoform X1 n=1 Tax=Gasterosteus aculeatus aculeatus TaxID=481459 RepID=UPI001A9A18DE|nr:interleukin-2 receptor subunit beta-like isoform X1 [Gasterosteus aculeatus aculeatus]